MMNSVPGSAVVSQEKPSSSLASVPATSHHPVVKNETVNTLSEAGSDDKEADTELDQDSEHAGSSGLVPIPKKSRLIKTDRPRPFLCPICTRGSLDKNI